MTIAVITYIANLVAEIRGFECGDAQGRSRSTTHLSLEFLVSVFQLLAGLGLGIRVFVFGLGLGSKIKQSLKNTNQKQKKNIKKYNKEN